MAGESKQQRQDLGNSVYSDNFCNCDYNFKSLVPPEQGGYLEQDVCCFTVPFALALFSLSSPTTWISLVFSANLADPFLPSQRIKFSDYSLSSQGRES